MRHRRKTNITKDEIILRFKVEALYRVKKLEFTFTDITCNNNNNSNNNNNNSELIVN